MPPSNGFMSPPPAQRPPAAALAHRGRTGQGFSHQILQPGSRQLGISNSNPAGKPQKACQLSLQTQAGGWQSFDDGDSCLMGL